MRLQINIYIILWLLLCMISCVKEEDFYSTETENIEQVSIELFTRLRSFDTPVSRAIALEDDVDKAPWILVLTGGDGTAGNAVFAEAAQANINVGIKVMFCLDHRAANHGY